MLVFDISLIRASVLFHILDMHLNFQIVKIFIMIIYAIIRNIACIFISGRNYQSLNRQNFFDFMSMRLNKMRHQGLP